MIKLAIFRKVLIKPLNFYRFFSSNNKISYYELLEIDPQCSISDIKKAYYKKVKVYHPDHNKDPKAEEHFKVLVHAYEILKDPSKRYIYDLSEKNPHFREDFKGSEDYVYSDMRDNGKRRAYYDNKWYGFRKNQENTLKDDYFERIVKEEKVENSFKILVFRMIFVLTLIIGFDIWRKQIEGKHKKFRDVQKEIIQNLQYDEKVLIKDKSDGGYLDLESYIKEREKANNAIDEEE